VLSSIASSAKVSFILYVIVFQKTSWLAPMEHIQDHALISIGGRALHIHLFACKFASVYGVEDYSSKEEDFAYDAT
jgi:hypothetical protein